MSIKYEEIKELVKDEINIVRFENLKEKIEVKYYLPILEKIGIIETIVDSSFIEDEETKLKRYNPIIKEVMTDYLIVKSYTNLIEDNLEEDIKNIYDILKQNSLIDLVYTAINKTEVDMIKNCVEERIKEEQRFIENKTNMGFIVEQLINKIKEFSKEAMSLVGEINENKLGLITNYFSTVNNDNGFTVKDILKNLKNIIEVK